ncbi:MAG TPA: Gfo/Idh/MocA family oxidoreductase [Streptosporangiaceae bacterium]|nr:Gfo/Idh/MocA family oxidoreductase [Streptosporangiaceae bacterium]
MTGRRLGIGLIGAGRWASWAHLPGWARDDRCEIVGVCDREVDRARAAAGQYGATVVTADYRELLKRDDIDIIDVVTRDSEHFEINLAAIEAGKHVLSEKPVAHDFRDVAAVADLAAARGLKTKVGLTFRYSPAVRYLKDMIDSGSLGTPFIYNAYEQNSQWLNPATPLRSGERAGERALQVASLEGYGAPVIDIGHWFMGSDLTAVVGVMRNFVPERMIADTGLLARVNIDDGDIFIGEFASGAICSVQTSFVTVGNYPGIEVRVYGSEGAAIARLVEEFGICETLKVARPDDVEFREVEVPARYYPPGGSPRESWRTLYYANLTANFASEVLGEIAGNEGNFHDGLWVQEVVNAVEISHHERRWVSLPLDATRRPADPQAG